MASERFAVVRVPFPFSDRAASKNRPALVLSDLEAFNAPADHSVMAMITSAHHPPWPLDCPITDLGAAGLPAPSKVRFKLFTLDHRLVRGQVGSHPKAHGLAPLRFPRVLRRGLHPRPSHLAFQLHLVITSILREFLRALFLLTLSTSTPTVGEFQQILSGNSQLGGEREADLAIGEEGSDN